MKVFKFLTVYLPLQFIVSISNAQSEVSSKEIQIDPRQYITVNYRKSPTQGKLDTIWNWENRKNVPNQKFRFIDVDGEIKIDFDKVGLIANKDFEGTISLEAEISGLNGTRKIEVNPYSEIGVQRVPIGIKSEPPAEISKKLLNMLRELQGAPENYDAIYSRRYFPLEAEQRTLLFSKINDIQFSYKEPGIDINDLVDKGVQLRALITSFNYIYDTQYVFKKTMTINEFKGMIQTLKQDFEIKYKEDRKSFITQFTLALAYVNQKTDIVLQYLNSFELAGQDATKAFLSLINKDLIGYSVLKNGLINRQKKLQIIDISTLNENDSRLDTILSKNAELIFECSNYLSELSRFKGSQLEMIMNTTADSAGLDGERREIEKEIYPYTREKKERAFYAKILNTFFENISDELTIKAGKIIYKKLIYATIDLGKSGAKIGEVLNIYITWILDSKRDSLANSPRLPIGKYYLREMGWKLEIADMFALIKRIDESKVDQTKVSPSNFKGSGGAVLMWTYNKEDNGVSIIKKTSDFEVKRKNRFINFLEPSIGLNVSYLDFSTEKDVEIGTGLQLGLFKNKIFFGYGINLHMISPSKQSPTYFYLGFSFARLSDLFKNSNSITVAQ